MTSQPDRPPFPTGDLAAYARRLLDDHKGDAYARFRSACDAVILGVSPDVPQHKFARLLGISRTTLRNMLTRLGVARADGRKAVGP